MPCLALHQGTRHLVTYTCLFLFSLFSFLSLFLLAFFDFFADLCHTRSAREADRRIWLCFSRKILPVPPKWLLLWLLDQPQHGTQDSTFTHLLRNSVNGSETINTYAAVVAAAHNTHYDTTYLFSSLARFNARGWSRASHPNSGVKPPNLRRAPTSPIFPQFLTCYTTSLLLSYSPRSTCGLA